MVRTIYIGNDHAAVEYKNEIVKHLKEKYNVVNLGTDLNSSVNYVDYADKVALSVAEDKNSIGILVCGTGVGISIAANKHKNIRCAILYNDEVAHLAKEHNNANIIAFGARQMELEDIIRRIEIFLDSEFEGGRHQDRIESMIS